MKRSPIKLSSLVLVAILTFAFTGCRQASSQTAVAIQQSEDPRQYVRDIDIPLPFEDRAEQILYRKAYIVSYNKETRQPNWVAWKLTIDHTKGPVPRPSSAWHEDLEVPAPRAYYSDYKGTQWDRGHMCPAGDNKWDSVAMYESFLMTNACPQNKKFNIGDWNEIEISCRSLAEKYGAVWIVCGPIFFDREHEYIGRDSIPVPEAFFKVLMYNDNGINKGIGYICRNTEGNRKKDFYVNTIPEVERITKIKFFPNTKIED